MIGTESSSCEISVYPKSFFFFFYLSYTKFSTIPKVYFLLHYTSIISNSLDRLDQGTLLTGHDQVIENRMRRSKNSF